MFRFPLAASALALTLALPAHAEGLTDMTDAERAAFGQEVRAYLLENPEVLMEAISVLEKRQAEDQAKGDAQLLADNAEALFDDGYSYVAGNPEGDFTIVEFFDYRCGYCKKAAPEVTELLARDGNIRLIVKEFPILGDQSVLASRFALAVKKVAGDEAYGKIHDTLMELRADITESALRGVAEDAGLDADAIMAAMDDDDVTNIIAKNHALGQTLKINGTPSFVFGDEMVRGYVPLDTMQRLVEAKREG
ncbi:DsbA family protein [Oceaniglobus roseus]|uniref:DsbA family protein n=1 Tax=Oceaniglobus roseus TaxID=1737570 RepID=UPI000C7F1C50|nr:DsbA family protein [Kandeliimicrobium roseum]